MHDPTLLRDRAARHADLRPRVDAIACALVTIVVLALKLVLLDPTGPVLFYDELLYKLGADALAGGGDYPSGQYPFLYPAILAPALAAGFGYDGIFYTNTLVSTTLIPATWLLAKAVGMRWAWPAAVLGALLPIHWIYPTQVLSENLSVALFAWMTWYAIRARQPPIASGFLFGVGLGCLGLTKYLLLPSIPVLWAIWLYGLHSRANATGASRLLAPAVSSLMGTGAAMSAWLIYAHTQDIGVGEALGAKVVTFDASNLITPATVVLWGTAYLSAILLLLAPFLPRLAEAGLAILRSPLQLTRTSPLARLSLTTLLLIGGYWIVCGRHSAFSAGNYPVPQRVIVRYFMHLTPVVMVLGLALTQAPLRRTSAWLTSLLALVSSGMVLVAHRVLYNDAIWDFPDWFARIPLYSTDIRGYEPETHIVVLALLVLSSALTPFHPVARRAWLFCLFVLLGASTAHTYGIASKITSTEPVHARNLAPIVIEATRTYADVVVIADIKGAAARPRVMQQALKFWGADPGRFRIAGPEQQVEPGPSTTVYRITDRKRDRIALLEYAFGSSTGYVYAEDQVAREPLPTELAGIITLEPASLCEGDTASASVSWDTGSREAQRVAIHVAGARGRERLFSLGPPAGSRQTPPWVRPGTRFVLRDYDSGQLLAWAQMARQKCD